MAGAVAMVKAFAAALVAPGAHVLTEFELHGFAQCALEELPEGIAGVAQQGGVVGVGCPRYDRVGHRVLLGLIEHLELTRFSGHRDKPVEDRFRSVQWQENRPRDRPRVSGKASHPSTSSRQFA